MHTDPGSRGGVGRTENLSARASSLPLPQLDDMTTPLLILRTSLQPLQRAAPAGTEGRDRALRGTDQEVSPKPSSGGGAAQQLRPPHPWPWGSEESALCSIVFQEQKSWPQNQSHDSSCL